MHEPPTERPPSRVLDRDARVRPREAVPDTPERATRELDHRYSDGVDVRLLWDPRADRVLVAVRDMRDGQSFAFEVDAARALDGFHHPYAYVSHDRVAASPLRAGAPFKAQPQVRPDQNGE